MRRTGPGLSILLLALAPQTRAQAVVEDREMLERTRPEAWAMNYVAAATFMTAFGNAPALAPRQWRASLELGRVPELDASQQQVGFSGTKAEDLNKSPLFGRVRLWVGLGAGWVAELGVTPPVSINGTRSRDLVAVALGRRVIERETWALSMRAFGQRGSVLGDITCPAETAGPYDPLRNPYGCRAASQDRIHLNYHGADVTVSGDRGAWQWHAGIGAVRTELEVRVDALTFSIRDRTRLLARDIVPYAILGANHALGKRWGLGFELLYVPLDVRRTADDRPSNDPMCSVRLQLSYRGGWHAQQESNL